jgi:phage-related protein
MATFPSYDPVYSATKQSRPNTRKVQFGDGYENRVSFGLNQNPKVWSLTFDLKDTDADIVETFLDARAVDAASFDWTPPGTTTVYKWVCDEWSREIYSFERSKIKADFRQVFEP